MDFPAAAGRYVPCCPGQVSAFFPGIPPRADRSFFLRFVLALFWRYLLPWSAALAGQRALFGSSLKGILPKRPLVPGGASAFGVREQSRSSRKKGTLMPSKYIQP